MWKCFGTCLGLVSFIFELACSTSLYNCCKLIITRSYFAQGLQTFIKQELQDTNLHQIVSSHSSLPHLLVSNSFCQPESYMNLGYNVYNNHAAVNIYNPISYGGVCFLALPFPFD